ncbi:MAG: hypothetical protein [Circular genetic element sp.]|nr:MAG: hypothetical protein [Circular genetic element sp.]
MIMQTNERNVEIPSVNVFKRSGKRLLWGTLTRSPYFMQSIAFSGRAARCALVEPVMVGHGQWAFMVMGISPTPNMSNSPKT